jgi:hypothetical protein
MAYTTIDNPGEYFNTVLYTGNNGAQTVTGVGFQPDWVWIKDRDGTERHCLTDSVRGVLKELRSNETTAESDRSAGDSGVAGVSAFNSDGFVLVHDDGYNDNNSSQVSWNWKAGTSFTNDASSTGVGSIDSAGSFNNDAGFSIVSYTGTAQNGTIKHGMNITPSMIIFKNRNTTNNWNVFHKTLGNGKFIRLNDSGAPGNTGRFNSTSPTSSVFSVGVNGANAVNGDGNSIIAYCFAEVKGYSKFGSFVSNNNSDNAFIYTGFAPAFLIAKSTTSTNNWVMHDNKRNTFNPRSAKLYPDLNNAEDTEADWDFLSNGMKLRAAAGANTFIYMIFAESPFVNSKGIPNNAR